MKIASRTVASRSARQALPGRSILAGSIAAALAWVALPSLAGAGTYYWDADGNPLNDAPMLGISGGTVGSTGLGGAGTWDTSSLLWFKPAAGTSIGADIAWPNNLTDLADFMGTGGAVTLSSSGVNAGALQFFSSGYSVTGGGASGVTLGAGSGGTANSGVNVFVGSGLSTTVNSVLSGSNGLVLGGGGTLTLTTAEAYTGGTTINSGSNLTIDFTAAAAPTSNILPSGGALTLNSGTLTIKGSAGAVDSTTIGGVNVNGGSVIQFTVGTAGLNTSLGTITHSVGGTLQTPVSPTTTTNIVTVGNTNTSGILGPWAFTSSGAGNLKYLTVNGNGQLISFAGTAAATAAALTDTTGTANYELAAGGTAAAGFNANTVRYTSTSAGIVSGATSFTLNGIITANTGTLTFNTTPVSIGSTNELVVNAFAGVTFSTAIQNNGGGATPGALTLGGGGGSTITLNAVNTYTGKTTVNGGTLALGIANAINSNSNLVVNGGTVAMTTFADTFAGVSLTSGTISATAATGVLTSTTAFDVQSGSITANLAGTAGLVKTTSGSVTVNGAAALALTGGITVKAGVLTLGGSANLNEIGNNTITLGDTSGSADAKVVYAGSNASYSSPIVLATGTTGQLTLATTNGTSTVTFTGGVTGSNNFTVSGASSTGTLTFSTAAVNNAGAFTNGLTSANTGTGATILTLPLGPLVTEVNEASSAPLTFTIATGAPAITTAIPVNVLSGTLNYGISGTATVNAASLLGTGVLTLSPGATLNVSTGSSGFTDVLNFSQINIPQAAGTATYTLSGSASSNSPIVFGTGGTGTPILKLTNTNGSTATQLMSGAISGTGNIQLNPTGNAAPITLSGAQNESGSITNVGTNATTTSVATVSGTIGTGITALTQAGVNPFTVSAAVPLNALGLNNFTSTGTGLFTISGAVSGAQNLTLNANSTGAITLTGGVNPTGSITNVGTGFGIVTISGAIGAAVTGVVENSAGSQLVLSGTNTYPGSSTATVGVLDFATGLALPGYSTSLATALGTFASPRVTAASGATVAVPFGGPTNSFSNSDIANLLNGTYGVYAAGSSLGLDTTAGFPTNTLTAVITNTTAGTLGFTKAGTNNLVVGTANTYGGPTAVINGTLFASVLGSVGTSASSLGAPQTAANGTVSLGLGTSTGTLSYTGPGETTDRVLNFAGATGGGVVDQSGSGALVFTGNVTFTGVGNKTVTLSGSTAATGTISGSFAGGILGAAGGAVTISKTGTGTWNLTGTGNTAQNIVISGGTLNVGSNGIFLSDLGAAFIQASGNGAVVGKVVLGGVSGGTNNGPDIGAASGFTLDLSNAPLVDPATATQTYVDFYGGTGSTGITLLSNSNSYSGITDISGQTVVVSSLNGSPTSPNRSLTSGLGTPTSAATAALDFTTTTTTLTTGLRYVGAGETTDRSIVYTTSTTGANTFLDQSGTGLLKFTGSVTATGASTHVLTLMGSTAGTGEMAGAIGENSTTFTTALTKLGTGTWTLSGANTYTGATTVNAGNLILSQGGGTGVLGNTAIAINAGGTLSPLGGASGYFVGNTGTAGKGGTLTLNAGGTLNLADGVVNPLVLIQNTSFAGNAATFAGGALNFDLGTALGANDSIDVRLNNVTNTGQAASSGSNAISINPIGSSLTPGTYSLIMAGAAGSTLSNANFYLASSNLNVGGTFYTLSLSGTTGLESLTVTAGGTATAPNSAYWTGSLNSSWSAQPGGTGTNTNFASSVSGTPNTFALPAANTNVFFTANTAANFSATTLDANFTVNSLNFTGSGTSNTAGSAISSGSGAFGLTINAFALNGNAAGSGITVAAGSGANSITAPVALGGSQTWTNNGTNTLSVTGGITDSTGNSTLTIVGTGTIALGTSNTFANPLNVGSGSTSGAISIAGAGALGNAAVNLGGTTATGTLIYTGTGETIGTTLALQGTGGGATLDQSGTGNVKFTTLAASTGNGAHTLTLQGNTAGTGEFAGILADNGTVVTTTASVAPAGNANTITLTSTTGMVAGMTISGLDLLAGTTISSIAGNVVTLSQNTVNSKVGLVGETVVASFPTNLVKTGTDTWTYSGNVSTNGGNITVSAGTLNLTGNDTPASYAGSLTVSPASTTVPAIVNVSGNFTGVGIKGSGLAGGASVYNQTAGTVITQNGTNSAGNYVVNNVAGAYGMFNLSGGTFRVGSSTSNNGIGGGRFNTNEGNLTTGFATAVTYVGGGASPALIDNTFGEWFINGYSLGEITVMNNGTIDHTGASNPFGLFMDTAQVGGAYGVLNLSGGKVIVGGQAIFLGNSTTNGSGNSGFINLAAGTLSMGANITPSVNATGGNNFYFNFAGGTLKSSAALTQYSPTSNAGITSTNTVFGAIDNSAVSGAPSFTGGAVFDTTGGNITLPAAITLLGASNNGVTQANLAVTGGSGYVGAPAVQFSKPVLAGGVPAAGYAVISGGAVVGIVITDPGVYGAGETPTITLTGGGATTAATVTASALSTANANTGGLTKQGINNLVISSAGQSFGGGVDIQSGLISVNTLGLGGANSTLGASSNAAANLLLDSATATTVLASGGGILQYTGTTAVTSSTFDRNFTLKNISGGLDASGTTAGSWTLTTNTLTVAPNLGNATFILQGTGTGTAGAGSFGGLIGNATGTTVGLTKLGSGTWTLASTANTYTGPTVLGGGTLVVSSLAAGGTASSIGASTNAASNLVLTGGATLQYTGSGSTSDRSFTLGNATTAGGAGFDSEGTGALVLTGSMTGANTAAGTQTLTLTANTASGNNSIGNLVDSSATSLTGVTKAGAGTWVVTGNSSYTGATTLTAGTLQYAGSSALGGATAIGLATGTTLQIRDDAATINHSANNLTVSSAGTVTIDVGSNGGGTTGSNVAFGALNNGTFANNFSTVFNFTGVNGYTQSYSSLALPGANGANTTLTPTTTSVTITGNVSDPVTSVTGHFDTLFLDGTSTGNAINGVISDSAGFTSVGNGDTRLTKQNTSTWTLTGASTFHGPTTITAGTLALGNGGSLGATAVAVNGGTFAVTPGVLNATNALAGTLTLAAGTAFTMADGTISTFNVTGASTLAPATGTSPTLTFDVGAFSGTTATDLLNIVGAATNGAAKDTIFINGVGTSAVTPGTYTLISAGSGLTAANFVLGNSRVIVNGSSYPISLGGTGTAETLTIGASTVASAYFTGHASNTALNATTNGGATTNFSSDPAGNNDLGTQPVASTDLYFTASNVTTPQTIDSLGANTSVNSLNYTATAPAITINNGGGNTLSIGLGGIVVANGSAAQTVNVPVTFLGSATITNNSANLLTLGAGAVAGSSVLTFAGSGATTLSGGTFTNSANVTVSSGAGAVTVSSPTTLGAAVTLTNNSANPLTFGTIAAGTNALTVAGTGAGATTLGVITSTGAVNLTQTGPASLAGISGGSSATLTDTGGPLSFTGNSTLKSLLVNTTSVVDLGASSVTLSDAGGTGFNSSTGGTINATGGGTIVMGSTSTSPNFLDNGTASGTTLTVNAKISGANGFEIYGGTVTNTGVTVLTAANTFTGDVNIDGGVLSVANIGNTGSTTSNLGAGTNIFIASAPANETVTSYVATDTLRYTGTGETTNRVINLNGTTTGGAIDQSGTGLLKFTANFATPGAGAKTLYLLGSTAGTGEIAGIISNNSATNTTGVTKMGTGTWTLSGANTYTGVTTIDGGTLVNGSATGLGGTGNLVFGDGTSAATGTLDLTNFGATKTALSAISNSATNTGGSTILIGAGKTLTTTGAVIVGVGAAATNFTNLTVSGAGTWTVGTAATPTNATFQVGVNLTTNISNGATVDLSGLSNFSAFLGTGTLQVGETANLGGTSTAASKLILAANNSITAATISQDSPDGDSAGNKAETILLGPGTNDFRANTVNIGLSANRADGVLAFSSPTSGSFTLTGETGAANVTVLNVGYGATSTTGFNSNANSVDLTGHNSTLSLAQLNVGGRLGATAGGAIAVFKFDTGSLNATAVTVGARGGSTAGTTTTSGDLQLGGTGTTTIGTGGLTIGNNVATAITPVTGSVEVSGSEVVTIGATGNVAVTLGKSVTTGATSTASLSITGGTVTLAGDLIKGIGAASANVTSTLTLNGGTLDMGGFTIGSGGLSSGNAIDNVNLQSGTLKNVNLINSTGGVTKTTAGTLTLDGTNNYTGPTLISAGTLQLGAGGTTGSLTASSITDNSALVFNRSNTVTQGTDFGAVISGSGSVTQAGSGTLVLSGANTYQGGTTFTGGTTQVTSDGNLGAAAGGVAIGNAAFEAGASFGSARTFTLTSANSTFQVDPTFNLSLTGSVGGSGSLNKTGAGTLSLSSFAGSGSSAVNVAGGVLSVTGSISGTTAVNVSHAATLNLGAAALLATPPAVTNNGQVNLNASTTFTSLTGTDLGATVNVIGTNTTLTVSSAAGNYAGSIGNTGKITISNGNQTFSGVSTFTGSTTIGSGATLQLGDGTNDGNLTGTSGITNNGTLNYNPTGSVTTSAPISGTGALNMTGTGTAVLSGVNTYQGGTNVKSGTLKVLASGSISGNLNVASAANFDVSDFVATGYTLQPNSTLSTSGSTTTAATVTGALNVPTGDTLAPGGASTLGNLAVTGSFTLGGTLQEKLSGPNQNDLLTASSVTLGSGALLSLSLINGYTPGADGSLYTIIHSSTGVTGTFSNPTTAVTYQGQSYNALTVTDSSNNTEYFAVNYAAGPSGNDVVLMAVPEPSAVGSLLVGLASLAGLQRFRRRAHRN